MLKVLDYFNLSDLYKFIPEDQKIADAGSSGPDDSKSDQEKSLPVLVEGNDDDDDDKWTILGNRSSTKTLYTSFRRNRNVSSTLCESKPEVTQLQRASSQHQNLVSSTQSLTPRDNQTYRHKQQDIYYDSTPLKHMRPQQIADKSRYIDISQSPSGPVLSSSYTGGYSSSSSYDGNTPTDSNEDGSHLGTPCISESLLEFTDSPSVTPTGFHLQDQSSSHSSQSSSKSPSPLLSELPAAATASEVEKGEDALEDREGDIRLSYAREYPNVSITIVGHESNGILLMCVHNGKQTFLNKFSMKDLNAQCLCTWDYKANITCATIDESQRVVAVSMRETVDVRKVDGDKKLQELLQSCHSTHVTIYSSYVQCVNDNTGKIQRVGEMSLHPQEVHFTCKNDGGTMYLVHGILSVSATLYSIVLGVPLFSTEKVAYIQKQPRKQATIVGRHFWYKYDHRHRLFHYIALKERKPELEFCTVSLREARPKVFVKSLMSMFFGVTTKNMLSPSWSAYPLPYSIGVTNENLVPQLPCVTPVVLPASRSVCVCVQHELDRRDPDHLLIPVSIVPLKIQSRIDYAIPVPEEVADPERLRVLFATIADFLMVFVPNVYLHLLDISDLHNPISGLILTGKETASFPHGTGTSETLQSGASLACIDTSYRNEAKPNGPRMLEHTFVDLKTGVMCEFEFDKKNLLRLIGAGLSPEKALHIALLHFRDEELADQVMHDVLNSPSQRISPDLFKEYILSHTFLSLRKDLPQQVLMGAPSTVVEQSDYLFTGLNKCDKIRNVSVVPVTSPRGGFEFKSVPSYKLRSFWRPIVQGACLPQPTKQLPLLIHKKPVLSVSSRYMDSYTRLREREVILGVDDPSLRTPTGELLNKVLISWMTGMTLLCPNMDTDMSVQSYAEKYHSKQARHVEMLFSTIVDTLPEDTGKRRKTRKLFFALECFQSAVTELGGIFLPHGFAKKFTKTGFYCLPKPLFLQYISRGLITVSKELVLTLYEKGAHKTDPEFFYTVLCGLPLYTAVDILLSDPQSPPPPLFVVDHFLSRYPNVLPSAKLELTDNSPFFPLETLLLSLKKGVTNLRAYKLPPGITAPQNMRNFLDGIEVISRIADLVNTEYFLPTLDVEMLQADKVTKKL